MNLPHPDIYLAAAAACGADLVDCVVIEDSATGVRAGAAAGCMVLGFAHVTDPEALLAAGAYTVFADLKQVSELLGFDAEVANLKR